MSELKKELVRLKDIMYYSLQEKCSIRTKKMRTYTGDKKKKKKKELGLN